MFAAGEGHPRRRERQGNRTEIVMFAVHLLRYQYPVVRRTPLRLSLSLPAPQFINHTCARESVSFFSSSYLRFRFNPESVRKRLQRDRDEGGKCAFGIICSRREFGETFNRKIIAACQHMRITNLMNALRAPVREEKMNRIGNGNMQKRSGRFLFEFKTRESDGKHSAMIK